jgi:hypothetical protein
MARSRFTSKLATVASGVLGLVLLAGLGYLLIQAIKEAPAVVGSIVTATGAVLAVVAGRVWEKRQALEQVRRERIAPTYSRLVDVFWKAMQGEAIDEQFFHEWAQQVLLWGPEPVIRTYNEWRASVPDDGSTPEPATFLNFERLLYAIRDDLGNPTGKMGKGDLLRVFVNDIDDFLANN